MAEEKLLTVREVSAYLGVSEKEVIDLAEDGKIPAYKVGGLYIRFKKEQIEEFRKSFKPHARKTDAAGKYPLKNRISDFFYFNDFYILAILIISFMLYIIFRGQ
jgi:excisionase family DNA binding protein